MLLKELMTEGATRKKRKKSAGIGKILSFAKKRKNVKSGAGYYGGYYGLNIGSGADYDGGGEGEGDGGGGGD